LKTEERIFSYLQAMNDHGASDLYITVDYPAAIRGSDGMVNVSDAPLSLGDINEILNAVLTSRQKRDYEANLELNTALDLADMGRFRVNVLRQRQAPAMVIRRVVTDIPSFADLKLPPVLEKLAMEKRGLVLVTGMTGSGKSTSLAAMIDYRNTNEQGHIVTIEDPVEFYHNHKKSIITQREVGVDTKSFSMAMKNSLRQRPDVLLVGEVRDREVMEQALMSAETGHLCLATIHTNNAYQAIERVVNLFPEEFHSQIRLNLSSNLKAVISQRLLPSTQGGLVPAIEVMLNEGLVRELIFKGEIGKIKDVMEKNNKSGMCTFDQSLLTLFMNGDITEETAISHADQASDMKVKLQNAKMQMDENTSGENVLTGMDTSRISLHD